MSFHGPKPPKLIKPPNTPLTKLQAVASTKTQPKVGNLQSSSNIRSNGSSGPANGKASATRGKGKGTLVANLSKKFSQPHIAQNVHTNIAGSRIQRASTGKRKQIKPLALSPSLEVSVPKLENLPTESPRTVIVGHPLKATITGALSAINTAKEASSQVANTKQQETNISGAIKTAASVASTVNTKLALVLPIRTIASSNASKLVPALNLVGSKKNNTSPNTVVRGKSKEEGNMITVNTNYFATETERVKASRQAKSAVLVGQSSQSSSTGSQLDTLANSIKLPRSNGTGNQELAVLKQSTATLALKMPTTLSNSLKKINNESSTNTPLKKPKPVKPEVPTQPPIENPDTIAALAQEQGFRPATHDGIMVPSDLTGIARMYAPNKVGTKTKKQILYNTTQQQKLLRKIRKAEAAASRSPSFFNKVLGGLGFYPGDGKKPQYYINKLQHKINKLDNNIAKGNKRLADKQGVAQNNATRKNVKATQEAIKRTKHYRDLLGNLVLSVSTGENDVPKNEYTNANSAKRMKELKRN